MLKKKIVVSREAAKLPCNKGGLAVPNLINFWDSLKLAWVTRLITRRECNLEEVGDVKNILFTEETKPFKHKASQ